MVAYLCPLHSCRSPLSSTFPLLSHATRYKVSFLLMFPFAAPVMTLPLLPIFQSHRRNHRGPSPIPFLVCLSLGGAFRDRPRFSIPISNKPIPPMFSCDGLSFDTAQTSYLPSSEFLSSNLRILHSSSSIELTPLPTIESRTPPSFLSEKTFFRLCGNFLSSPI